MSPTGRTVALLAVAAVGVLWWPAPLSIGLVVAVVAVALGEAIAVRRVPTVRRTVPAEVVRGVPVPLAIEVAAGPLQRVRVRQPQTGELRVTPAEGDDGLVGELVAVGRGRHELPPVVVRVLGPLGLVRWVHEVGPPATVTAHADLPGARRLATAVRQGRFADQGRRRGPLGLGTDFENVREYRPEDDVRRINWLAGERTGRPMANQYREETEREVWCLVDAGRLLASPVGDRTRLDVALDAVAAVAAVADVAGDRIGAVTFAGEVLDVVAPRRAAAEGLVRRLDLLEPRIVDSDYDAAFAQVAGAKRALVVVFTDLFDRAAAAPLVDAVPILLRRHAVLIASVVDPDLARAVAPDPAVAADRRAPARALVAGDLLAERDHVRAALAGAGAVVVEAEAERLPSACVVGYLRLKSTARL